MIAITGITGKLGSLVLQELLGKESVSQVIGLARTPENAKKFAQQGVEIRPFNFDDPHGLSQSLSGIRTLLLVSGTDIGPRVQQHKNVIDAAIKAKVNRIVYTSIVIAGKRPEPIFQDHKLTEDYIKGKPITFTILRNNYYMDPYLVEIDIAIEKGAYRSPNGTEGAALISRKDISRACAEVLLSDKHAGKIYELTGTKKVTPQDFAAIASSLSGKEISYEKISFEDLKNDYLNRGTPKNICHF